MIFLSESYVVSILFPPDLIYPVRFSLKASVSVGEISLLSKYLFLSPW